MNDLPIKNPTPENPSPLTQQEQIALTEYIANHLPGRAVVVLAARPDNEGHGTGIGFMSNVPPPLAMQIIKAVTDKANALGI